MIDWLDRSLNRDTSTGTGRKAAGFVAAFLIAAIPAVAAYGMERGLFVAAVWVRHRREFWPAR